MIIGVFYNGLIDMDIVSFYLYNQILILCRSLILRM